MPRRKKDSDTWHYCKNCSNWPTSDYVDGTGASGEKCNECMGKQKAGNCTAG